MAFSRGPKIVTDGLVLALDAGSHKSNPGSGTNMYDLSGFDNNSVLTNGATFSSNSVTLDGVNDFGTFTYDMSSTSEFSIEFWAKTSNTGSSGADFQSALAGPNAGGSYIRTTFSETNSRLSILFYINGNEDNLFTQINIPYSEFDETGYNHYVLTAKDNDNAKIYRNSELKRTAAMGSVITTGFSTVYQRWGNYATTYAWEGEIAVCKFYTKVLDSTDITQNYNATKGRFNL